MIQVRSEKTDETIIQVKGEKWVSFFTDNNKSESKLYKSNAGRRKHTVHI